MTWESAREKGWWSDLVAIAGGIKDGIECRVVEKDLILELCQPA
jgi:hypothetical protein